jgi:hypothetical protein
MSKKRFRSQFEKNFALFLDSKGIKYEFETTDYDYWLPVPSARCNSCNSEDIYVQKWYTPDFILPNGIVIETKGKFTGPMRTKMKSVIDQHPDEDIRIVFMYNNKLSKRWPRYSDWCEAHNIKYHVVEKPKQPEIPESWLQRTRKPLRQTKERSEK